MNPYQVMGVIVLCVSLFAAVVTFLVLQGVPVPAAFLGVYLVAVGSMLGMQRRARQSSEGTESRGRRRYDGRPVRASREAGEGDRVEGELDGARA